MRFTKPSIAALRLPPGKSELIAFDETLPGFGIRLRGAASEHGSSSIGWAPSSGG